LKIAVDAMGGDYAPAEIVAGSLHAMEILPQMELVLVGDESVLKKELPRLPQRISLCHASEVMGMDESVEALRKKRNSSIWIATKLVKEGEADAVVSAGSTAAQMASALLQFGRIKGIDRPAIPAVFPTLKGGKVVLDVGANTNVRPEQLLQFAVMGKIYGEKILKIAHPRIALLSNGSEEGKGNDLTIEAHELLKNSGLNFIGNIEGRDVPLGDYDVVVCDGFVGNVLIKLSEGLAGAMFSLLKKEFEKNLKTKLGAALILPGLKNIKKMMDYAEYGGAPLLGVRGISIICHGSSQAKAIQNAIKVAADCVSGGFVNRIAESINMEE